jgi:cerevisin
MFSPLVCLSSSLRLFQLTKLVGLNIKSTWTGSPTAVNTISGTSMASPHTAGMLAYLLSIYPSTAFDPLLGPDFLPPSLSSQSTSAGFASVYALAHAVLPSWVSEFLPSPRLLDIVDGVAPTGPPTLTPDQLKKALIALSSKDMLATLPAKTPNLLIFNNATA